MHMRCGFALALAVALGAAVSAATFKAVWKSPEISEVNYAGKKIAALIISDDFNLRMSAEEALARELTDRGADGVAAYRLIPKEELRDKTNPQDVGQLASQLVKDLAKEMRKQGLVPSGSK